MAGPLDGAPEPGGERRDVALADRLLAFHRRRTGRWSTPTGEAWQPAVALEGLINVHTRTGDPAYLAVLSRSFARYRGRRSRYFDDDGWYLNVWLSAYEATGERAYLAEARALFDRSAGGWDGVCGGGLWWRTRRDYKNAITNELFLLSAARLHRLTGDGGYRDWALREWTWFEASGLINSADRVNDGLDAACHNNGGTPWTYNQGVILGGLAELYRMTGERDHLARAARIADATIAASVYPDGVLTEPNEQTGCGAHGQAFKGIFGQGLARLYRADPAGFPRYLAFLRHNADRLWAGRDAADGVGERWPGPATRVTAATQASALLLVSELALIESGYPEPDHPGVAGQPPAGSPGSDA